jgi:hypothetical protein
MKKTIILISIFILISYGELINGDDYCTCQCCRSDSCTPKVEGSFFLASCDNFHCMIQCREKYSNCPPECSTGLTVGICTSQPVGYAYQYKPNFILTIIFMCIFWIIKLTFSTNL